MQNDDGLPIAILPSFTNTQYISFVMKINYSIWEHNININIEIFTKLVCKISIRIIYN